ncbi:hypothetical protein OROHE_004449 [Orobanche hederae]
MEVKTVDMGDTGIITFTSKFGKRGFLSNRRGCLQIHK